MTPGGVRPGPVGLQGLARGGGGRPVNKGTRSVSGSTMRALEGGTHGDTKSPTLAEFVRHAERFGVECVYESAEWTRLPELGSLARHLRRIEKSWRLSPDQRDRLIAELRDRGLSNREIADMAGVSLSTVVRAGAGPRDSVVKNRMVEPRESVKSRGDGDLPASTESDTLYAAARYMHMLRREPPPVRRTWREWVYGGARIRHVGGRR